MTHPLPPSSPQQPSAEGDPEHSLDQPSTRRSGGWTGLLLPLLLLVAGIGIFSFLLINQSSEPSLPSGAQRSPAAGGYDAMLAKPVKLAPPLGLSNYLGGPPVDLAAYRGKAVLVTFLYTHCPDVCPLITANLRAAQEKLGAKASEVQIIAVSADPHRDTRKGVAAYLARQHMVGRMLYLIGSPAKLSKLWADWSVGSQRNPATPRLVAHSALVYGITASGKLTTIYPASFDPSQIVHDVPLLASR